MVKRVEGSVREEKTFDCLHVNRFTLNYFPLPRWLAPRGIIVQPNISENKQTIFENDAADGLETVTKS